MLIHEYLERSRELHGEKTAVVIDNKRYSYNDISGFSKNMADRLSKAGVGRHDRVIVQSNPSKELIATIFGTSMIGAAFVILSTELKGGRLDYILNDCKPAVVVSDDKHREYFQSKGLTVLKGDEEASKLEVRSEYPLEIDLAMIIYTSGSTGSPKGVMLSHRNVDVASDSIIKYLKNTEDDIILSVLPLSFDYGLYQLLMSIKFSGTIIIEPSFIYPHKVLDKIGKEKVTGFPIVPTIGNIINHMKKGESYDFSSVRYISNTAQALEEKTTAGLKEWFPNAEIFAMYGLTECKRVSYLDPSLIDRKPNSVGKAMPFIEVYLIDGKGEKIEQPGVIGELVVRGPNVMMGYWNSPEETEKRLLPGRYPGERVLLSGDLFYFDEDNDLFFVSRKDEIIKTAGERVNPIEVESFMTSIDGVLEVIVIPVPDEIIGNALKAVISLDKDISLPYINRCCREGLENFMIPKYFQIVDDLPKSSNGKLDRKRIKKENASPETSDERKPRGRK